MKLRDIISTTAIIPALTSKDRDGALREMVSVLPASGAIPASAIDEVLALVLKREANGSTGFGRGVAVPHTRHSAVTRVSAALARAPEGLDFNSLDGQPVYTIFLLVSPAERPQLHMQAMHVIFEHLQQRDAFRKSLRTASTVEKIVELLDEADAGR